jgi:hypothetical protein
MTLPVADYSFARPADYAELARQVSGVMRYTSNGPNGKNITRAEADLLKAHGIPVGITWENEANSMLRGAAAGRPAAASSVAMTRAAGLADGVTYYACDFDATLGGTPTSPAALANMRAVADFLAGAASVTGWDDVGCYGDLYVLQWLAANTPLRHGWQTGSMSEGRWANWQWSGPTSPITAFVQNEFWIEGQHEITISGCPVDLSTVLGDWRPRTTVTTNGDLSMADAASLEKQLTALGGAVSFLTNAAGTHFSNIEAQQAFALKADGARFDALASALQVLHAAVVDGAEGKPVDFAAMAHLLEGAHLTLASITPPASTAAIAAPTTEGATA